MPACKHVDFFTVDRLGLSIGQCPERYIAGCLIVCSLCSLGLMVFEEVSDPDRLWVPRDAQVRAVSESLFETPVRVCWIE